MPKQTISAKELLAEVRAGLDDRNLMTKYGLSAQGLQSAFRKLVEAKALMQSELDNRVPHTEQTIKKAWKCPACGQPQMREFGECPECGIIEARFLKQQTEKRDREEENVDKAGKGLSQPQTGYVEGTLIPGEQVVYRGKVHWAIFLPAIILPLVICIGLLLVPSDVGLGGVPSILILFVSGPVLLLVAFIIRKSTELAVTGQRVVIKVGLISRTTLEMNLAKVENIQVNQSILGRMFDYGSITVVGTGGTDQPLWFISAPYAFRKAVQAQSCT